MRPSAAACLLAALALGLLPPPSWAQHPAQKLRIVPLATMTDPLGPSAGTYSGPNPRHVAFSADGRFVAVSGEVASSKGDYEDQRLAVWDARSGKRVALLTAEDPGEYPEVLVLSSDGSHVALGSAKGTYVWSVKGGRLVTRVSGICSAAAFVGAGPRIVLLRVDGTLADWDGRRTTVKRTQGKRLLMGAFLADRKHVVALRGGKSYSRENADWHIVVVDTNTGKTKTIRSAIHNGRMQYFSVAERAGIAAVFEWWHHCTSVVDALKGQRLPSLQIAGGWRHEMAISPDGRLLLYGNDRGEVLVADRRTGREVARIDARESFVQALGWSPDGSLIATIVSDDETEQRSTVRLWRVER